MAMDGSLRKKPEESVDKAPKRNPLGLCARIFRSLSIRCHSPYVTYTHGVCIMAETVSARLFKRTTGFDSSVETYKEMIADTVEASIAMPGVDILGRMGTPFRRRRAVNDYFRDPAHDN